MGDNNTLIEANREWSFSEKLLFRAVVVFVAIAVIPLDLSYLKSLLDIQWGTFNYTDVDLISNYYPWYVDAPYKDADGHNYLALLAAVGASIGIALIWGAFSKAKNYTKYLYWLHLAIRYKVAGVMLYFALVKVFPVQMPFPSLSQLNTAVGDYTPGRLFWITTGASESYEIFGGIVELSGTLLLLSRRYYNLGAFILLAVMIPVIMINIGYDAGVQIKAILIVGLLFVLVAHNLQALYNFFVKGLTEKLNAVASPDFISKRSRNLRLALKLFFIVFFFGFRAYSVGYSYFTGKTYKRPSGTGLSNVRGIYNVSEFQLNDSILPYNPLDSNRWQNVIFEEWNTVTIKQAKPILLQASNKVRKTEIHSNVGRHYYQYNADTATALLTLKNRANDADSLSFTFTRPDNNRIILKGINANKDSISIVLDRLDREYPLIEGRHPKEYTTIF